MNLQNKAVYEKKWQKSNIFPDVTKEPGKVICYYYE